MSLGLTSAAWAGIGAVGSIGLGAYGASKAGKAADAQVGATRDANAEARRQFDQTRQDQMPWMEAGKNALHQLATGTQPGGQYMRPFSMEDYKADPGYQFRLQQGQQGIERSAAARGGLLSGAAAKAIARYNSDQASQEFGNAYNRFNNDQANGFNRLASLAGVGQTAVNNVAAAGQGTSQQVQNNLLSAGNARASGYVGSSNALMNGFSQAMGSYQNNQLMNRLAGSMRQNQYAIANRSSDPLGTFIDLNNGWED